MSTPSPLNGLACFILVVLLTGAARGIAAGESLLLATDGEYAPFSMMQGAEIGGISTEIIKLAFTEAGIPYRIGLYPWLRGNDMALKNPDVCAYPVFRTAAREALFKWVGPLAHDRLAIFARAGSGLAINGLDAIKPYRIGAVQGTAVALYLESQGIPVELVNGQNGNEINLKKLQSGRIDLWAATLMHGLYFANSQAVAVEPVLPLQDYDGYLACNLAIADEQIAALNQAIQRLTRDGSIARLSQPYL